MPSTIPTQERFVDPFSQSIFQFGTPIADVFISRANNLTMNILGKDLVLGGVNIDSLSWNSTDITVDLTSGWILQDATLIVVEPTTIVFPGANIYNPLGGAGKFIIHSNYQFLQTLLDNPLQIKISYIDTTGPTVLPDGWDINRDRIIIHSFDFTKSGSNLSTVTVSNEGLTFPFILPSYSGLRNFYYKGQWVNITDQDDNHIHFWELLQQLVDQGLVTIPTPPHALPSHTDVDNGLSPAQDHIFLYDSGEWTSELGSTALSSGGALEHDLDVHGDVLYSSSPSDSEVLQWDNSSGKWQNFSAIRRENFIINGAFNIWQRATSNSLTGGGFVYTADRWGVAGSGLSPGGLSITRSTNRPIPKYYAAYSHEVTVTTPDITVGANDLFYIIQKIEAQTTQYIQSFDFITLSFWVISNLTGTFCVAFQNDLFGVSDASYVAEYTIIAPGTWELKTITIPFAFPLTGTNWSRIFGTGLRVIWTLMAGSTYQAPAPNVWNAPGVYYATSSQVNLMFTSANYLRLALVQLELGTKATPFAFRHHADEFSLCQRYYEEGDFDASAYPFAGFNYFRIPFKVTKWTAPSSVIITPASALPDGARNINSVLATSYTVDGFTFGWDPIVAGSKSRPDFTWSVDTELT